MALSWELVWLCLAALAAGAVNSIAGGGTLLTFPALLAWLSPLGAADTAVGIAIGVACKWIGSFLYYRCVGKPAR